jgi:hypothetical protein
MGLEYYPSHVVYSFCIPSIGSQVQLSHSPYFLTLIGRHLTIMKVMEISPTSYYFPIHRAKYSPQQPVLCMIVFRVRDQGQ